MKTIIKDAVPGTYNLKTLAQMYRVCTKTMKKQIDLIAEALSNRNGRRLYFVNDVETIFKYYGTPKIEIILKDDEQRKVV